MGRAETTTAIPPLCRLQLGRCPIISNAAAFYFWSSCCWLVTAVQGEMWFNSYSDGSGCHKDEGGGESSNSNSNSSSNSSSSSASTAAGGSTDAKEIVAQVFLILAVGVAMSTLLLLITYLQLKYCKNCGLSRVARSSSSASGGGGGGGTVRGRHRAAVDTSLAAQANLTGMSKQERSDVLEHLFLPYMVASTGFGGEGSHHPPVHDDVEKAAATSPPASHHAASRGGSESFHNTHDHVWESDELPKDLCCSICLSGLGTRNGGGPVLVTPCQHKFHYKCCREWLQKRDTCPYCRTDLFTVEQLRVAALDVLGKERLEQLGADPRAGPKLADDGPTVVAGADSASTASATVASPAPDPRGDESI